MNHYGNLSKKHSLWSNLLIIYNLPYRLYMKRKYITFSTMISRPSLGNDINVYLTQLIKDFRLSWDEGAYVFDTY